MQPKKDNNDSIIIFLVRLWLNVSPSVIECQQKRFNLNTQDTYL